MLSLASMINSFYNICAKNKIELVPNKMESTGTFHSLIVEQD